MAAGLGCIRFKAFLDLRINKKNAFGSVGGELHTVVFEGP